MERGSSWASPGVKRWRGGGLQAGWWRGGRPAGSVAFHRAAWGRGRWKKTPLPLVGRVGWLGWLRLGDR